MEYKIVETKERALADNEKAARQTLEKLKKKGVFFVNLMGSPGAGKTSTLLRLIEQLGDKYKIGIIEADVASDVDARTLSDKVTRVIQIHTGGLCHMDADMTERALNELDVEGLDLVFLENIGNLVCPAEFEVGANLRLMILSVPEGDDKPLKYPLMFTVSDAMIINKTDACAVFDFDIQKASNRAHALNSEIAVFPVSAKTGDGFKDLAKWLDEKIRSER